VTYAGDANVAGATSNVLVQTVTPIPTSLMVSSSLSPAVFQQAVTLSAKITPASATGSVQFTDAGKALGAANLSSGTVSLPANTTLAVGTHPITAVYNGDSNDAPSTSAVFVQTVNKIATTTVLTASPNPATFGQSVLLSVAVTPGSATGSVQFVDSGNSLGTGNLSGGTATLNVPSLAVGAHALTAVYSSDANNAASTSAAVTETVNRVPTTVALSSSPNPSTVGQAVILTATVTPSSASGSVQLLDGPATLGTPALSGGTATFPVATLTAGSHALTASYPGDTNDAPGNSGIVNQTVNVKTTAVALSASPNPSTFGQTVNFTAQVSPSTATGGVQLLDSVSGALVGSGTLSGGTAVIPIATLAVGAHSVVAKYGGDASNGTSTSSAITQTVNKAPTAVSVSSSPNPSNVGQPVTFTVGVAPTTATGSASLVADNTNSLGSATLSSGSAQVLIASLAAGVHTIIANYLGDGNDATSSSTPFTQTVNKLASNVTVATSNSQSIFGQPVTFTATVTPPGATGSMQFRDGSTVLGTSPVASGVAQLPVSSLSVATHSITAVYSGDANNATSTSAPISQFVLKASTATTLSSSPNPSTLGQAILFTAQVAPAAATGSVQFMDSANLMGTSPVNGGIATLSVSDRAAATHSFTAVYSGDANFNGSTSSAVSQTVNKPTPTVAVTSSPNPSQFGQPVTVTAKITPGSATGSVQFLDGTAPLGTGAVSNSSATVSVANLAVGAHDIVAQYGGDANNAAAAGTVTQTVSKANTTVAVTSSLNPSVVNQPVVLTAKVTPANATGSIQFEAANKPIGSVIQLSGGAASITVNSPSVTGAVPLSLPAGANPITAIYSGDGNFNGSTSPVFTQTIDNPSTTPAPTTTLHIILGSPGVTVNPVVLETTKKPS
jgi:hypothetical protein